MGWSRVASSAELKPPTCTLACWPALFIKQVGNRIPMKLHSYEAAPQNSVHDRDLVSRNGKVSTREKKLPMRPCNTGFRWCGTRLRRQFVAAARCPVGRPPSGGWRRSAPTRAAEFATPPHRRPGPRICRTHRCRACPKSTATQR